MSDMMGEVVVLSIGDVHARVRHGFHDDGAVEERLRTNGLAPRTMRWQF